MKKHCPHVAEEFVNACGINTKDKLQKEIQKFVEHAFQKTCVIASNGNEKVKFASGNHTVCTSNLSGIQTNAFEFAGMQKGTSFENKNEKILAAAASVIQHGKDTLGAVITSSQKDHIFNVVKGVYDKIENSGLANKADFDNWYDKNKDKTPIEMFKPDGKWNKPGGIFDKKQRDFDQARASITQNHRVKGDGYPKLVDHWIKSAEKTIVNGITWKTKEKKDYKRSRKGAHRTLLL